MIHTSDDSESVDKSSDIFFLLPTLLTDFCDPEAIILAASEARLLATRRSTRVLLRGSSKSSANASKSPNLD